MIARRDQHRRCAQPLELRPQKIASIERRPLMLVQISADRDNIRAQLDRQINEPPKRVSNSSRRAAAIDELIPSAANGRSRCTSAVCRIVGILIKRVRVFAHFNAHATQVNTQVAHSQQVADGLAFQTCELGVRIRSLPGLNERLSSRAADCPLRAVRLHAGSGGGAAGRAREDAACFTEVIPR